MKIYVKCRIFLIFIIGMTQMMSYESLHILKLIKI